MGSSPLSTILLIALMVVAFYFLLLRPQKKRQQAQQKTMNEIQPGTRVLLGSGIFGTVVTVGEKQAVLETSPGVEVTILKQAIARVIQPGDEFSEPVESTEEFEEFENEDRAPYDPEPIDPVDPMQPAEPATSYESTTSSYESTGYERPDAYESPNDNPTFGNDPKKASGNDPQKD